MKVGGRIPWNAKPLCVMSQISCLMRKHIMNGDLAKPCKGPIIPFGSLVEYHTIIAKDQSRIHQFGKPGLFLGYALYAG